ncbi:MAG: hypothetical protein WEC33_02295 [Dehalococcoidia bacterium]
MASGPAPQPGGPFSGYPDGERAMAELHRVLRRLGRDLIRDMPPLFERFDFEVHEEEIGGFGSVHLFVATKR